MSETEYRYFVLHLPEDWRDRSSGKEYEVQVVDRAGRATAFTYIGETGDDLSILGHKIPVAVIDAARRQQIGKGDFVDDQGNSIAPVDL